MRFFFCGEGTRPRAEATAAWWQCNLYASFLKKEKIYTRAVPVRCSHHPCPSLIQVFSIFGSAPCSTAADRERSIITPEPRGRESSPTRTRNHKRDHHQASSRHPFSSGMHEHDADGDLPPESMLRRSCKPRCFSTLPRLPQPPPLTSSPQGTGDPRSLIHSVTC